MRHTIIASALAVASLTATAQNPIICDRYTPDPAPYVHGDTLYLFVDHDEDVTVNNYFTMKDWLLYSTVDMVNWTYLGTPFSTSIFKWAKQGNDAWASQCIERNGKWYWYCTATVDGKGYPGIGVAVADRPEGPYRDILKKPIAEGWYYIDPTVFIDDNDQAYLFWGNNNLWYAKLRSNMQVIQGSVTKVQTVDEKAFGPFKGNKETNFEEASWVYKLGDTYYLEYAAGGVPEHWAYATAKNIAGPWTYGGKVMGEAKGSFTIHGGSVRYKGHDYMFYHNGGLPGGGGYHRSTCVEEFKRGEDGSIPFIPFTTKGVDPIANLDPYAIQQAETINQSSGILCTGSDSVKYVTNIKSGNYIRVRSVDFGEQGAAKFCARVKSEGSGYILVRTGSATGKIVSRLKVSSTDGEWQDVEADVVSALTGVKDLYFTFSGSTSKATLFDFDRWQFTEVNTGVRGVATDADRRSDGAVVTLDGVKHGSNDVLPRGSMVVKNGKKVLVR